MTNPFPQEIVQLVVDKVQTDRSLLKELSLVSSSWRSAARTHLFSSICLSGKADFDICREMSANHSWSSEIFERCIRKVNYEPGSKTFNDLLKEMTNSLKDKKEASEPMPSLDEVFAFLSASSKKSYTTADPPFLPGGGLPSLARAETLHWNSNLGHSVKDTPGLRQFLSSLPNLKNLHLTLRWEDAHAAQAFLGLCGNGLKVITFSETFLEDVSRTWAPSWMGPSSSRRPLRARPQFDLTSVEELVIEFSRIRDSNFIVYDLLAHSTPTNLRTLSISGDVLSVEALEKLLNFDGVASSLEKLHLNPVWAEARIDYGLPKLSKPFSSLLDLCFGQIEIGTQYKQNLAWVRDFVSSFPKPSSLPLKAFTLDFIMTKIAPLDMILNPDQDVPDVDTGVLEAGVEFSWEGFIDMLSRKFPGLEVFKLVFHSEVEDLDTMETRLRAAIEEAIPGMDGKRQIELVSSQPSKSQRAEDERPGLSDFAEDSDEDWEDVSDDEDED